MMETPNLPRLLLQYILGSLAAELGNHPLVSLCPRLETQLSDFHVFLAKETTSFTIPTGDPNFLIYTLMSFKLLAL